MSGAAAGVVRSAIEVIRSILRRFPAAQPALNRLGHVLRIFTDELAENFGRDHAAGSRPSLRWRTAIPIAVAVAVLTRKILERDAIRNLFNRRSLHQPPKDNQNDHGQPRINQVLGLVPPK